MHYVSEEPAPVLPSCPSPAPAIFTQQAYLCRSTISVSVRLAFVTRVDSEQLKALGLGQQVLAGGFCHSFLASSYDCLDVTQSVPATACLT